MLFNLRNLENVLERKLRTVSARECIFRASGGIRFKNFCQPRWRKGGGETPRCNRPAQKKSRYVTVTSKFCDLPKVMTANLLTCLNLAKWLLAFLLVKPIWHSLFFITKYLNAILWLYNYYFIWDRKNIVKLYLVETDCKSKLYQQCI